MQEQTECGTGYSRRECTMDLKNQTKEKIQMHKLKNHKT